MSLTILSMRVRKNFVRIWILLYINSTKKSLLKNGRIRSQKSGSGQKKVLIRNKTGYPANCIPVGIRHISDTGIRWWLSNINNILYGT
jgi:hypothetical protein